ncbi:MAG TPA: nickel pincer cofactor biosynthesis protein LarB [Longimicrobiales bacterium]|nr:nickel pincer cofactor biosynthesis protein LarB [Longimicrobiales bacterium]
MTPESLKTLLEAVARGDVPPAAALERLALPPVEEVGDGDEAFARLDHHRALRLGFPEVVFFQNKTPDQAVAICRRLAERDASFFGTRADAATQSALREAFPTADVNVLGRTVHLAAPDARRHTDLPPVVILSAGTSDLPVAEEAAATASAFGHDVDRIYDVGVAGIHRVLNNGHRLQQDGVIIVVAGMEGALPSVVGGLTGMPVVAVPTSVGYGAAFGGIAALLGMLNSCASGVTVVNIDNGFGAACAATRILRLLASQRT